MPGTPLTGERLELGRAHAAGPGGLPVAQSVAEPRIVVLLTGVGGFAGALAGTAPRSRRWVALVVGTLNDRMSSSAPADAARPDREGVRRAGVDVVYRRVGRTVTSLAASQAQDLERRRALKRFCARRRPGRRRSWAAAWR